MDLTTEEELGVAMAEACDPPPAFVAKKVEHDAALNVMVFTLGNGGRLVIPVEDLQELAGGSHEQLSHAEILGPGTGIHWPDLDADLYVEYLVKGARGNAQWMRQLAERYGLVESLAA